MRRETFQQLERRNDLPSDDFTRQKEVGALLHGYEWIALTFYRWVDLSRAIHRDDSCFSVWPEDTRDAACAAGSRICVSSSFTISAPWRRAEGCSLKDVLGALLVERFLLSDADALAGTMRADRGMSRLTDRLGARRLRGGVVHHGVEVNLVPFFRGSCARRTATSTRRSSRRSARGAPCRPVVNNGTKDAATVIVPGRWRPALRLPRSPRSGRLL